MQEPFKTDYYVYEHRCPVTKDCLYVGMGKGTRAYATGTVKNIKNERYGHRSPEHSDYLDFLMQAHDYLPHEWIIFHHRSLTKSSALKLEKELIDFLKPRFNRKYGIKTLKFNKQQVRRMKLFRDVGLAYIAIAEIMGCSVMVAHRILNDKSPNYREMFVEE